MKKIAIGSDHAGFELKRQLINYLEQQGFEVKDFGAYSSDRADYPDFAHPVSEAVEQGEFEKAVLICGSANGISMTANKHQGIRAGIAWIPEIASLAKQHNNANLICIPARYVDPNQGKEIVNAFLSAEFEGMGSRVALWHLPSFRPLCRPKVPQSHGLGCRTQRCQLNRPRGYSRLGRLGTQRGVLLQQFLYPG